MPAHRAARRYAKAAFDLAREQGREDDVLADLKALGRLLEASEPLRDFVGNYLIPPERRRQAIDALFEGRVHPLTLTFLGLLERKKRLGALAEVAAAFAALHDEARGILRVEITSAAPLTPGQRESLAQRLVAKLGRQIDPAFGVDPALIAGFRAQVGDQVYDYSVDTQLKMLNQKMAFAEG
jgi:F-type H+-transporting ATPase subunit delta